MTQNADKLFAEYRKVLAEASIETLIGRYAVQQVRSETAMSIGYLNGCKRSTPEKWNPEYDEYLVTLHEINTAACKVLNEVPATCH